MAEDLLNLLSLNSRLSSKELAQRLDQTEEEVQENIKKLEDEGVIRGYVAVIDENYCIETATRAIINVKIIPEREGGFDKMAQRLSKNPEVTSLYLISGQSDLQLEVKGKTLQDVSKFVSEKLATIKGVTETSTHFLLKKYKESGKLLFDGERYERLKITP